MTASIVELDIRRAEGSARNAAMVSAYHLHDEPRAQELERIARALAELAASAGKLAQVQTQDKT